MDNFAGDCVVTTAAMCDTNAYVFGCLANYFDCRCYQSLDDEPEQSE